MNIFQNQMVSLTIKIKTIKVPPYPLLKQIKLYCPCGSILYRSTTLKNYNSFVCYKCKRVFDNPIPSEIHDMRYKMDRIHEIAIFEKLRQRFSQPVRELFWSEVFYPDKSDVHSVSPPPNYNVQNKINFTISLGNGFSIIL